MNKILLTGFSGFTGKYILQEAEKLGMDVVCLSEDGKPSSAPIDLLDYKAVSEKVKELSPNSLIHLAALSYVQHEPASDFYDVNIGGTRNILQAIAGLPNGNLVNNVFASSSNVYGVTDQVELDEKSPLKPVSDYGLSKKAMEELVFLWHNKMPVTITRPFNYTGVGQRETFLVPKIVDAFKSRREQLELGNIDIYRDFSDVRFIAKAYLTLASQRVGFRVLNLCSGNLVSIKEIISICARITGHELNVLSVSKYRRHNEILKLKGDAYRMTKALGYNSPYSIEDTLEWMLTT